MPGGSDLNPRRAASLLVVVAVIALAACGSSSATPPTVVPTVAPTADSTRPQVTAGHGTLVLGGELEDFRVTSCADAPGAGDSPQATRQFLLVGSGEAGSLPFTVTVTRFVSDGAAATPTYTETATVATGSGDQLSGIEAKRSSVAGKWLDLNDPAATTALINRSGSLVTIDAKFGPEGSRAGDPDITTGVLTARCPG